MTISVTHTDIEDSVHDLENNPISRALQRTTGQCWRVYPGGVVFQVKPPYRTLFLPMTACRNWMEYQKHGVMQPLEFDLELSIDNVTDNVADSNHASENRA